MKLSLSTLFLLVALFGVVAAWWSDHRELRHEINELNSECANLFENITHRTGSLTTRNGEIPSQRSYNFQLPADRHEYRRLYGHLMSPWGQLTEWKWR